MKYAFILISFLLFCSSAYADISDYVSPRAAFFGFILIVFLIYFYIKDKISEKEELNTKARIKIEEEQYESQKKIYETAWDDYHSKNYNTAKISFARINNYKLIRSSNYGLGLINLNSKSKDYDLAIKHFKFASEKGHKDATFELAKLQMKGKFKSDSDYMKLSRNLGNLDALYISSKPLLKVMKKPTLKKITSKNIHGIMSQEKLDKTDISLIEVLKAEIALTEISNLINLNWKVMSKSRKNNKFKELATEQLAKVINEVDNDFSKSLMLLLFFNSSLKTEKSAFIKDKDTRNFYYECFKYLIKLRGEKIKDFKEEYLEHLENYNSYFKLIPLTEKVLKA